jgi:two-component system OmpR family sensor kinase
MALSPDQRVRFLSLASHDLRGTLGNVRTWASLLRARSAGLDERGQRATEVILRNTDRALAQQQALFDLLRAEWAPMPLAAESTEVAPAVQSLGTQVAAELPAGLPSVRADPDRLQHVLRAFVARAVERSEGAPVVVRARAEPPGVAFEFEDGGPPPDEAALQRTFDPVSSALHEQRLGTGFELGVAAEEVRAMGGTVRVAARPTGALHAFWLPSATGGHGGSPSPADSG